MIIKLYFLRENKDFESADAIVWVFTEKNNNKKKKTDQIPYLLRAWAQYQLLFALERFCLLQTLRESLCNTSTCQCYRKCNDRHRSPRLRICRSEEEREMKNFQWFHVKKIVKKTFSEKNFSWKCTTMLVITRLSIFSENCSAFSGIFF